MYIREEHIYKPEMLSLKQLCVIEIKKNPDITKSISRGELPNSLWEYINDTIYDSVYIQGVRRPSDKEDRERINYKVVKGRKVCTCRFCDMIFLEAYLEKLPKRVDFWRFPDGKWNGMMCLLCDKIFHRYSLIRECIYHETPMYLTQPW
jgi:hypothetical protein